MDTIITAILSATVMGAVVTVLLNVFFKRRLERITHEIKIQSEKITLIQKSQYTWKEQTIAELLGPINILLNRTRRAFDNLSFKKYNPYTEDHILKSGNEQIRNLLLQKSHLIPLELMDDANKLISHYDRYLEEYEEVRGGENPDYETANVFAGPKGFPFPTESAKRFQEKYTEIWREVYG